jgi:hypothetical protein
VVTDIKVHILEEKEGQQEKNIENHSELNIDNSIIFLQLN